MSGCFNARRHRRRPSINITSLIDVMFLLLIFFMVSSTFRHHFGIDITLPEAETASDKEAGSHEITVNAKGEYYFGQEQVDEEGLRRLITETLRDDPDTTLILRADDAANFGNVLRAIDIARATGGSRLIIPTRYLPEDDRANE
jgi:biopolymer transport protein ExbD